jgi:hypothetical protein
MDRGDSGNNRTRDVEDRVRGVGDDDDEFEDTEDLEADLEDEEEEGSF